MSGTRNEKEPKLNDRKGVNMKNEGLTSLNLWVRMILK
jgi:hypothetical protein